MAGPLRIELAERSYDIHIGSGVIAQTGSLIAPLVGQGPILVIADSTVAGFHGAVVMESLKAAGLDAHLATFTSGEPSKSLATADGLFTACAENRIDRAGTIVALGGGVTGDMAGFVAACWMRGIRFVQIPTTLLAMVDSSVGGKTAVNSSAGKNLIGAFKQPAMVIIDPDLLRTMDGREYRAGLAEVLKYGVIKDPDFFTWQEHNAAALINRDATAVAEAVRRSCAIKAQYVAADEREQGVRAHLNYGHTFGHAIEGETGYTRYLHGEGVAIGMRMAAAMAQELGILKDSTLISRQDDLLKAYRLPMDHSVSTADEVESLVRRCGLDKKVQAGRTRFIVPSAMGHVDLIENPDPGAVRSGFLAGINGT